MSLVVFQQNSAPTTVLQYRPNFASGSHCIMNLVRGSFKETAPRKTAENTVEHCDGGVGSMVANHCDGK